MTDKVVEAWRDSRASRCRRRLTGKEGSLQREALLGRGLSPHRTRQGLAVCVTGRRAQPGDIHPGGEAAGGGGGLQADQTAAGMARRERSHLRDFLVVVSSRRLVLGTGRTIEGSGMPHAQATLPEVSPERWPLWGWGRHPAREAGAAWGSPWWEVTSLAQKNT